MEILKEIAKDRLVVMVTHNPDLAAKYSNRTIRLFDGRVTDDTNPYSIGETGAQPKVKRKKISMSYLTAVSLSLNNLLTKKTRTILTAFAGSIGIIGIALIMSLSSGMQGYISDLERDTLSMYPLELHSQSMDMSGMLALMMGHDHHRGDPNRELDRVYTSNIMTDMMQSITAQITTNNLGLFKEYLEGEGRAAFAGVTNSIQYGYNINPQIYMPGGEHGEPFMVNPNNILTGLGMGPPDAIAGGMGGGMMNTSMGSDANALWVEMLDRDTLLEQQYDIIAGRWPQEFNEVVLIVSRRNGVSDYELYSLGLLNRDELDLIFKHFFMGEDYIPGTAESFTYEEILSQTYKLVLNTDYYVKENGHWADLRDDREHMRQVLDDAPDIRITGIIRPAENATATSLNGTVGYTAALTEYIINAVLESGIAKEQLADPETNVFTGHPFDTEDFAENLTMEDVYAMLAELPEEEAEQMQAVLGMMGEEQILALFAERVRTEAGTATFEENLTALGVVSMAHPSVIRLYPKGFDFKKELEALISAYNEGQEAAGYEENVINYTDIVGLMTSSISSVINITSYVLIAFVSISLIVSSIMIAIITYISVLERTKEIGILRSIGAAKRDISRVFNAETLIEGFVAGVMGIGITLLLNIPANAIIERLTDISGLSRLPPFGAAGLIVLSVFLTMIAGFIPSKMAAKKDPVVALRSE
jgi:putative ABC transport system permease protein